MLIKFIRTGVDIGGEEYGGEGEWGMFSGALEYHIN